MKKNPLVINCRTGMNHQYVDVKSVDVILELCGWHTLCEVMKIINITAQGVGETYIKST